MNTKCLKWMLGAILCSFAVVGGGTCAFADETSTTSIGYGAFYGGVLTSDFKVIWKNTKLSRINYAEAYMCGTWCSQRPLKMKTVAFSRSDDGSSATGQFLQYDNGYVKCFKVEYQQQGDDVAAKLIWGKYSSDMSSLNLDWEKDVVKSVYNYVISSWPTDATSMNGNISVTYLRGWEEEVSRSDLDILNGAVVINSPVTFSISKNVTVTNDISGSTCRTTFRKDASDNSCQLTLKNQSNDISPKTETIFDGIDKVSVNGNSSLPTNGGTIVLTNGTTVILSQAGECKPFGKNTTVNIHANCVLDLGSSNWRIDSSDDRNKINLVGGKLTTSAIHYFGSLTMSDGATITRTGSVAESAIRFGFYTPGVLTTTGTSPCYIKCGIAGARYQYYTSKPNLNTNTINTAADLYLQGNGLQCAGGYSGFTWLKKGKARLIIEAKSTSPDQIKIEKGSLVLAATDAISQTNLLIAAGGTIEASANTENTIALTLQADSTLVLNDGAKLSVEKIGSGWDTTKRITISAPLGKNGIIGGLKLPASITEEQLASFRYNDGGRLPKHIRRLDSGEVLVGREGMILMLKWSVPH